MKILAASDIHGNLDGLDLTGIDIAILAGDIAILHGLSLWDKYDQINWMNNEFKQWCNRWPNCKIVFVPGNHDFFPLAKEHLRRLDVNTALNLAENATMLVDEMVELDGLKIYGSPWVPTINYRWAFEADDSMLKTKFDMIPEGLDILVTHCPPRLELLDVSLAYGADSDRFGSNELTEAMLKKKPKMCFCGHIHSGQHEMAKIGSSKVWNVSRVDEQYKIAYGPIVVEL